MSSEFKKDNYFKIDPEPHLIGELEPINHFPGVQMWWRAIENIRRYELRNLKIRWEPGLNPSKV